MLWKKRKNDFTWRNQWLSRERKQGFGTMHVFAMRLELLLALEVKLMASAGATNKCLLLLCPCIKNLHYTWGRRSEKASDYTNAWPPEPGRELARCVIWHMHATAQLDVTGPRSCHLEWIWCALPQTCYLADKRNAKPNRKTQACGYTNIQSFIGNLNRHACLYISRHIFMYRICVCRLLQRIYAYTQIYIYIYIYICMFVCKKVCSNIIIVITYKCIIFSSNCLYLITNRWVLLRQILSRSAKE